MTWFWCLDQNWLDFCVAALILSLFESGNQSQLDSSVGSILTLLWCKGSKCSWFLCANRTYLGFSAVIEIGMMFVWVVEVDLISV